jgi:hypothetical protein
MILTSFLLFFLPIGTNRASNNGGLERLSFGKAIWTARAVRKRLRPVAAASFLAMLTLTRPMIETDLVV